MLPSALASLLDDAFPSAGGDSNSYAPLSTQTESVEVVTLAQLAISSYGAILRQLMEEASRLSAEDDWWAKIESDNWQTGFFLLQCESCVAGCFSRR